MISRPVPHKRTFPARSFGPGVAIDASNPCDGRWTAIARRTWWEDFNRAAGESDYDVHENRAVLKEIEGSEAVGWRDDDVLVPQPTWGFYVFLTDYDQVTKENVSQAMENWVELIRRIQGAHADPPDLLADEASRRFKLDLVEEQDSLDGASTDRVRECFRALVRSLHITDEEDLWVPPTRNKVCLVLDANKVQLLANLTFCDEDDSIAICRAYETCRVQAVDIHWQRPAVTDDRDTYRGVKDLCITSLARAYIVYSDGVEYGD